MKKYVLPFITLSLAAAGTVTAAPTAPPPLPAQQQQSSMNVSSADVEKFAEIYVDVETTRSELAAEMSGATDPEEAQKVQARMRDEIIGTIEDHGWSLNKYNEVAQAITADRELKEQALDLINQKSS